MTSSKSSESKIPEKSSLLLPPLLFLAIISFEEWVDLEEWVDFKCALLLVAVRGSLFFPCNFESNLGADSLIDTSQACALGFLAGSLRETSQACALRAVCGRVCGRFVFQAFDGFFVGFFARCGLGGELLIEIAQALAFLLANRSAAFLRRSLAEHTINTFHKKQAHT